MISKFFWLEFSHNLRWKNCGPFLLQHFLWLLSFKMVGFLNPLIHISKQDRISPYNIIFIIKQANREKYHLGEYQLIQTQILPTYITRIVWETVRRMLWDLGSERVNHIPHKLVKLKWIWSVDYMNDFKKMTDWWTNKRMDRQLLDIK